MWRQKLYWDGILVAELEWKIKNNFNLPSFA